MIFCAGRLALNIMLVSPVHVAVYNCSLCPLPFGILLCGYTKHIDIDNRLTFDLFLGFPCEQCCRVFWRTYCVRFCGCILRSEILGDSVCKCPAYWRLPEGFTKWLCLLTVPPEVYEGSRGSMSSSALDSVSSCFNQSDEWVVASDYGFNSLMTDEV